MFQLTDGLNGLDLTRRGHVVPAGNEFEGQEAALGLLPLPDLGEAAFAQRLAEFAPRIRLHAYLQRQGLTHDTRSPRILEKRGSKIEDRGSIQVVPVTA